MGVGVVRQQGVCGACSTTVEQLAPWSDVEQFDIEQFAHELYAKEVQKVYPFGGRKFTRTGDSAGAARADILS